MRDSVMYMNETAKKKLSCCQGCSRKWVLFMNGVIMVSGIVLLALAVFNSVTSGDVLNAINQFGIIGTLVAGAILILTSALGCLGVIYKKKFLMVIYILLSMAGAGLFLGTGILLTFLVDDLNNVEGAQSQTLAGKVEGQLNDFLIAVFNECCFNQFDNIDKLLGCNDPAADQNACFTFIDDYEAALERVKNTGLCNTLENVNVDGFPVVGDPAVNGGCAGGDGVLFKAVFTKLVEDTLVPIGIAFMTISVLMIITLIASCVILCANQDKLFEEKEVNADDLAYKGYNSPAYNNFGNAYDINQVSVKMPAPTQKTSQGNMTQWFEKGDLGNGTNNPKYQMYGNQSSGKIGF